MRGALLSLCLGSALFAACSSTDSAPGASGGRGGSGGSAGSAGNKAMGGASASNAAGEGGAGGTDEGAGAAGDGGAAGTVGPHVCIELGKGDIELVIEGLPKSVAASVTIAGPHDALESESTTLSDVPGGTYAVSAKRVYDTSPLVRKAYDAQISSPTFCLEDGASQTVTVSYSALSTGNQLWTLLRSHGGAPLRGFGSDLLAVSGSPDATTESFLPLEHAMAFDHAGDIWGVAFGSTSLVRYAPFWLGGVGEPHADYEYKLALDACVPVAAFPAIQAITLDASENIWLSACDKKVLRFNRPESSPGSSEEPEDIAPAVRLSGLSKQSEDLAFDSAGNLWVAAGGQVLRFDRARLERDDSGAPDLTLSVTTDEAAPVALNANFLAFDVAGNLWATDAVGHTLFEIAKTDLAAAGTQTAVAKVRLVLGTPSRLTRPAFDDEGSLWLSLSDSSFGKLTAQQLAVSSTSAAPTVPSVLISTVGPDALAFFPAASGLPLPSAQP